MATYVILNMCFLAAALLILRLKPHTPRKPWLLTIAILFILTAIFDSLIIHFQIVGYNPDTILGLYVGKAPIEDFFYAILAAVLVPVLWNKLGATHVK